MRLAVFDLDGTLLRGNSSITFCRYLIQKKVISRFAGVYAAWNYFCHLYGRRSLSTLHEKIFTHLLRGKPFSLLEEQIDPFLSTLLPDFCYRPAVDALRYAQHMGDYTLILSNSPSFLVGVIASYFGVDEWGSSKYALDKEGRLCRIASIMQGKEKMEYMQSVASKLKISSCSVRAYSDSWLDLPLLKAVGRPIAVKPDRKLEAISFRENWEVI